MRFRFELLVGIVLFVCPAWIQRPAAAQEPLAQTNSSDAEKTAPTRNLTVDDYFKILEVEDAHISPQGKWVCYTVTTHDLKEDKDKTRIWMISISGGAPIPLTAEDVSSEHARWSPDGKYLAFLSGRSGSKSDKEDEEKKKE